MSATAVCQDPAGSSDACAPTRHAQGGYDWKSAAGAFTRILILALFLLPQLSAAIRIDPDDITDAYAGKPFSFSMTASGGAPPYNFSIVDGGLPSGISLTGNTISGTAPITIYGLYWIVVEARDSAGNVGWKDYYLRLFPASITLTTASLTTGKVGVRYSVTLLANGGLGPLTFRKESGDLPPGLTMANNVIQGTPTTAGTYPFVIRISDYFRNTATFTISITISAGGSVELGVEPSTVPNGEARVDYVPLTFTGVGGAGNYTLTLKGDLPDGMSFVNNTLTGIPAATSGGVYTFTIEVRDGAGALASRSYTLIIGGLTVEPSTLAPGAVGVAYGPVSFTATGGTGRYTFSLTGSLPSGLVFTDGTLSGTPAPDSAGAYSFSIVAHDEAGGAGKVSLSLTITAGSGGGIGVLPMSLSIPSIVGAVGEDLHVPLWASGGMPPYTFSVSAGSLPAGVVLSAAGVISGIPSQRGAFTFTVTVRDSAGTAPARRTSIISINGALTMVTSSLPALIPKIPYWAPLAAAEGVPPYTWIITSGVLPAGLALNWLTGVISGTTTETSGFYRFVVQVSDGGGASEVASFILGPDNTPLAITSNRTLPAAGYQQPYKFTLAGTGPPPLTWLLEAGALPPGLEITRAGEVKGVPTVAGTFIFSARVMDSGLRTLSQEFTLTVNQPLRIKTAFPLPDALLGTVSMTFTAEGGVPPYSWSVSGGSLPPGFALSPGGVLSGSTKANGAFSFDIAVTDSTDARTRVPFSIRVAPALSIDSASLPGGASDTPYSATLSASGGTSPYRWSASGLPPEFSLDPVSGVISGVSPAGQQIECKVTVTDQVGSSVTRGLSISIETSPLTLHTKSLPDAVAAVPYSTQLAARGGTKPYAWSVALGALPAGLRLAPNGIISGMTAELGDCSFRVAVVDAAANSRSGEVTLRVRADKFVWEPGSLPDATVGAPYSFLFAASGGTKPYGWSITGGVVPAGLRISPDGAFFGAATQAGTFRFSVTVVDAASNVLTGEVEVRVLAAAPKSPGILFLPSQVPPVAQIPVQLMLDESIPPPAAVTLELSFAGQEGRDDPTVQFSTGGRTAVIDLAAVRHAALSIQTGSTAGILTVQVRMTAGVDLPLHPPVVSRIEAAPPVIGGVEALRRSDGIELVVTGYSTTREVSGATFRFERSAAGGMQPGVVLLPVAEEFRSWFDSPQSGSFGGQFRWRHFFPVSDPDAISRVSVSLESAAGRSGTSAADVR